jgi:hypothetical protein
MDEKEGAKVRGRGGGGPGRKWRVTMRKGPNTRAVLGGYAVTGIKAGAGESFAGHAAVPLIGSQMMQPPPMTRFADTVRFKEIRTGSDARQPPLQYNGPRLILCPASSLPAAAHLFDLSLPRSSDAWLMAASKGSQMTGFGSHSLR